MRRRADPLSARKHREIGTDLFNYTWSLLDRRHRSAEEDDEMLHAAHASRYHWGRGGRDLQRSIGEWQISRVYSVLGRSEPALYHARRAYAIARHARLAPFYLAYAYEALARAAAIADEGRERDRYLAAARRTGRKIRDSDDRRMLTEDLASVRGPASPDRIP